MGVLDIDASGIASGTGGIAKGLSTIVNVLSPYTTEIFYGIIGFILLIKFLAWVKKKDVIKYENY